jgi:hypothetical protein
VASSVGFARALQGDSFFFPSRFIWRWHLDSAGGFLLEKDIILSIGLLLLSVAGNDRAGF